MGEGVFRCTGCEAHTGNVMVHKMLYKCTNMDYCAIINCAFNVMYCHPEKYILNIGRMFYIYL